MSGPITLPYDDITIFAGPPDLAVPLSISKRMLRISTVLRGWLDHPDSRPLSVQHGDAIILEPPPEVVIAVLAFLLEDQKIGQARLSEAGPDDIAGKALFLMRVHKLAICLAVDSACSAAMERLRKLVMNDIEFMQVMVFAVNLGFTTNAEIRSWMTKWVLKHLERLLTSPCLENIAYGDRAESLLCLQSFIRLLSHIHE